MIQFYRTHEAPWKTLVMAFFNPERQLVADVDPSPQSPVPPRAATTIRETSSNTSATSGKETLVNVLRRG